MNEQFPQFYEFGEFRLDAAKRLLWHNGEIVPLMPKAFDVLLKLVQNRGQVVTKDDLMTSVWHDTVIEENSLNVNVSALRKIFREKPNEHRFIVTVPGMGYEFVADVREVWNEPILPEPPNDLGLGNANFGLNFGQTTNPQSVIRNPQSKRTVLFTIGAVVILIITGFGLSRLWNSSTVTQENHAPFQVTHLAKLTSGKAFQVAISPDGKQVAYIKEEADGQSLWLRQVAIDSEVRLVAPQKANYREVVYGRDGNFIYYTTFETDRAKNKLYEIPALGGTPRKIFENVNSRFALAHDGQRLAFFRDNEEQQEQYLVVAQTDGTGERRVATNKMPDFCWGYLGPVWSPDDSRLACHAGHVGENIGKFIAVRINDGSTEDLTPREWKLSFSGEWTPDGLIVSAQQRDEDQWQLWQINPTNGAARRLTNDLHDYSGVSLTADGHTLATIQTVRLMNVWLVDLSETRTTKQITAGASIYYDISFTPDDKLLYSTRTSGLADIWQTDLDGANRRQLTKNAGSNYSPVVSPDGRYLIFHSSRSGTYFLYRTSADGSNPQRLTNETDEEATADISPDGKTVVFAFAQLKRVPIEGGTPVVLNDKYNYTPVISPDGKLIAAWHTDDFTNGLQLALFSIDKSGEPLKVFDIPLRQNFGERVRWTKDKKALLYINTRDGVSNIWRQPIDGSAPTQFTDFKTERIFSFDVSPDGKQLAIVRGAQAQDVVLLSDK